MSSTLNRLFTFAKATGAAAIENFTTEALAAAVRRDPGPLAAALAHVDAPRLNLAQPWTLVETQVPIEGGQLDLLLEGGGVRVALEVKVHAGASGDQLARYLEWADAFPDPRPQLVVLSRDRISESERIHWLPWQVVWRAIRKSPAADAQWTDFAQWLEENGMADDRDEWVTDEEAQSLHAARALLRKAVRILAPATKTLNQVWKGSDWPETEADLLRQVASRFIEDPTLSAQHRKAFKCGLSLGLRQDERTDETMLAIWVWGPPRRVADRDRIHERGKTLSTEDGWSRDADWELLSATRPLARFASHEEASDWLIARIRQLAAAGMFSLLDEMA